MTNSSAARHQRPAPAEDAALTGTNDLMEALVAACTLMAHADGELATAERRRIFAVLRENPAMSVFSREEVADEVASHEANFAYDPELAQHIARERVAVFAGNRRAAAKILAACRELITADGIAHPAEYRALKNVRELLRFEDALAGAPIAAAQR